MFNSLYSFFGVHSFGEVFIKLGQSLLLLIPFFYYIYPHALGVFGFTALVPMGAAGLLLYAYNQFPFSEVYKVLFYYLMIVLIGTVAEYLSDLDYVETFRIDYTKTQMGLFFTAYLLNYIIFKLFKDPKFEVVIVFLVGVFLAQAIISLAMTFNPAVDQFFHSLQLNADMDERMRGYLQSYRIVGYGSYVYGGGAIMGYGCIVTAFFLVRSKLNLVQLLLVALVYCLVFFVGLFTARTATVGAAFSILLVILCKILDKKKATSSAQLYGFIAILSILVVVTVSIIFVFFEHMTEWGFELFYNLEEKGELSTESSNALYYMFEFPDDSIGEILLGEGVIAFRGNDQGFARILSYFGFIGAFFYFFYSVVIANLTKTKDTGMNILLFITWAYAFALNFKGLFDLNHFFYLYFFYMMFYKYYRYYPRLRYQNYLLRQQQLERNRQLSKSYNEKTN